MASKLIQIRDTVHSWLAAVNGAGIFATDISGAGQRIKGYTPFLKVQLYPAVQITWGREEGERAELRRYQRDLFMNLIILEKRADQGASDDSLAELQADVKNRLEVPDSVTGKWLGLTTVDIKNVVVEDVDPIEVSREETEGGIVAWVLTVRVRYRHDRGGA